MLTTLSGHRTSNQQELSVIISNLSISTSSQGQAKKIMAESADGIQYPYLEVLDIFTSEYLKLYNTEIIGIQENDSYDMTGYRWSEFYQELEDAVSTVGFKETVLIVRARDGVHITTEVKNIILFYPSTTRAMSELHCKSL